MKTRLSHPNSVCRRIVPLLLICGLTTLLFAGCSKELSAADAQRAITEFLQPQVKAYAEAFQVNDLTVDVVVNEYRYHDAGGGDTVGTAFCTVNDYLVSPTISKCLSDGTFTDEMLRQISAVAFDYSDFVYKGVEMYVRSVSACPVFRADDGKEYVPAVDLLTCDDVIVYIADGAELTYPAKVGDNLNDILSKVAANTDISSISGGTKCVVCNGTGYVRYYYGNGDSQYNVGKCTSCKGTGKN